MPCCSAGKCLNCTSCSTSAPADEATVSFQREILGKLNLKSMMAFDNPHFNGYIQSTVANGQTIGKSLFYWDSTYSMSSNPPELVVLKTEKRGHLLNRFHWQPLHSSSKNPLNSKVIHYLEIPWGMDEERHGGIWQSFQPSGHLASPEFIRKISHLDSENPKKNSNGLQKKNQ